MDFDTDSSTHDRQSLRDSEALTFAPDKFRTFKFSQDSDDEDKEERGSRQLRQYLKDNDSVASEKFKTLRIDKHNLSEILQSRNSSRSVLHLPLNETTEWRNPEESVPFGKTVPFDTTSNDKPGKPFADTFFADKPGKPLLGSETPKPDPDDPKELDNRSHKTLWSILGTTRKRWSWLFGKTQQAQIEPGEREIPPAARKKYVLSFWVVWVWSVLAVVCTASVLCFIPWLDEASLWFPHFRLYLERSSHVTWIDFFDEFLKVISYFATDLRGLSRKDYDPNIEFISNSAYSFDYSSWCRDIPMTASTTCYSGRGMDVISGIVTDLGVQIGVAGRMDNPVQFGANFAATFKATVHDIDRIYREIVESAHLSAETSTLDIAKLALVHKAAMSMKLGNVVWILKVVHVSCMLVFSFMLMLPVLTREKPTAWLKVATGAFLVLCEACVFSIYTLETIYLGELNGAARVYDVMLTAGLGSTLMIVEFLLGVVLGVLYIVN